MELPTIMDNEKRFIFTNWSNEDFEGRWNGEVTIIKKGETKEFMMALAYHFTKHFVDREMMKDNKESNLSIDELRAPYEAKTMAEITSGTDSPALASLKKDIEQEIKEADGEEETEPTEEVVEEKPKRKRRTKAEMEAEKNKGEFGDLKK